MAGALLAFLIHNFPPALVYLGDGGAYFLGFLIGAMAIISSNKGSAVAALVAPLLALGLPIADTCVTLLRRVLVGVPLFRADRHHLHHRLMRMGFTRRRAVLVLYGLSALCLLGAFMAFASEGRWVPVLVGALFVLLTLSLWRLGLAQTWQGMRQVMDDSLRMRKDSQYALSMVRWLELEAERCESIDELWTNFEFVARKLGFCHVKLSLEDGQRLWQSNHVPFEDKRLRRSQHEIAEPCPMSLEFTAERRGMSLRVFEQLAELAAEGWIRSARRWREITGAPVRFSSDTAFVRRATGWRGVRKQLTRLAVGGGS
jgi:UDP-GlcNAc:undecaprenyl-phosphate GlcNAc-1-phosphate transferase